MPSINRESGEKPRSIAFYVFLGAALFAFIQSYSLLSPILLSFLLVILISLAVNPLISWIRSLTGGRKVPAGLVVGGFVVILALTGWAFFEPMRDSVENLSVELPTYWERLQKPLIRMEQQAARTEEKLQAEVATESAGTELAEGDTEAAHRISESTQPAIPGRCRISSFKYERNVWRGARQFHRCSIQRNADVDHHGDSLFRW
jgi:predicted PurR-regulated permease PerM